MAKYKKRKDGRYQANIITGYDEETGKRKYETIYATSTRQLEDKKAELKDQLNKGIYANDKSLTIDEWSEKWFETHKATSGIKTKEMYNRLVFKHIIPALGDIRLKELVKSDIQKMINDRQDHPRTCQQIKMCINQILEAAIDDGLIYKNVCRNISLPQHIKREKRALTEIEKNAIKNADLSAKERAFIYIIQYCGLRRGETLALSKSNIDFNRNIISVRRVVVFEENNAVLKEIPKSVAGIRDIPMPSILSDYLKEYVADLKSDYLFEMHVKDGFMTKSSYTKFWYNIITKLNQVTDEPVYSLTAHVFRHNYATMLFYAGIDVKEAQYLLGHTDVKLTLNIYTHLDRERSETALKLDRFLGL